MAVPRLAPLTAILATSFSLVVPAAAQQDPQAAKILDAMSAKYTALKSFQAALTQTLENPAAKLKQNTNGDLTVSGPKYRLVSSGKEVICDGVTTWIYDKEDNGVTISGADAMSAEITPSRLFTFYKTGYKYQLLKTVKEGGFTYNLIELAPEDKKNDVFKVQLQVAQMDKSLGSVKTFKKNGTTTTIAFKNFKPNVPVTDAAFTFSKAAHPGVEVVDLRESPTEQPEATPTPSGNPPVGRIPSDKLRPRKPKFIRPKPNK
jgi:outer membrane lipoprotein carrier protein